MARTAEQVELLKQRRRAFSIAEMTRLCAAVPRYLDEHGPTDFAVLVKALGATVGRLSMAGKALAERGIIHRYRAYPGRDSRRMWSLEPRPEVTPRPRPETRNPDIGMDPEHLAWMERQRRKAAERMARAERMMHL